MVDIPAIRQIVDTYRVKSRQFLNQQLRDNATVETTPASVHLPELVLAYHLTFEVMQKLFEQDQSWQAATVNRQVAGHNGTKNQYDTFFESIVKFVRSSLVTHIQSGNYQHITPIESSYHTHLEILLRYLQTGEFPTQTVGPSDPFISEPYISEPFISDPYLEAKPLTVENCVTKLIEIQGRTSTSAETFDQRISLFKAVKVEDLVLLALLDRLNKNGLYQQICDHNRQTAKNTIARIEAILAGELDLVVDEEAMLSEIEKQKSYTEGKKYQINVFTVAQLNALKAFFQAQVNKPDEELSFPIPPETVVRILRQNRAIEAKTTEERKALQAELCLSDIEVTELLKRLKRAEMALKGKHVHCSSTRIQIDASGNGME